MPETALDEALIFYGGARPGPRLADVDRRGAAPPGYRGRAGAPNRATRSETDLTVERPSRSRWSDSSPGGRVIVPPFDIAIGQCAVVADPWNNQLVLFDNSQGELVTDEAGNVTGVE